MTEPTLTSESTSSYVPCATESCERAGLGFSLVGLLGLQNAVEIDLAKTA